MKIEMYVLCLLRFQDGTIVFTEPELDNIKDAIAAGLQKQQPFTVFTGAKLKRESRDGFEVYSLNPKEVGSCLSVGATIESAEIGYYHHRVIVYLRLDSADDFSKLREVRDQLKQRVDEMIEHCVKEKINELVRLQTVRAEAEVEFFYTYPLIIVKKRRKRSKAFPFSEETGSTCFDIVEPSRDSPAGKRHMMRVSIPSTILYPQGRAGIDLIRNVINAMYQYCLYAKRSTDERPFKNVLDESLLIKLWEQIIARLGSRTIDIHTSRITYTTSRLARSALIVSIIALIISIISIISRIIPLIKLLLQYFGSR
jgi:hypothetical protein